MFIHPTRQQNTIWVVEFLVHLYLINTATGVRFSDLKLAPPNFNIRHKDFRPLFVLRHAQGTPHGF